MCGGVDRDGEGVAGLDHFLGGRDAGGDSVSYEKRQCLRRSGKSVHFGIFPYCWSKPLLYITNTASDLS